MSGLIASYLDGDGAELRWGLLPEHVWRAAGSEAEWQRLVRAHSLGIQATWCEAVGSDESSYLEELLRNSRDKGMLYPYHLAEALAAHPRIAATPFEYYQDMLIETMRAERSYDTIPNFTAADCVRLVGVGRNEFIHALNQCRSKGWLWKRRRGIIAKTLPSAALPSLPVLHWWRVHATKAAHTLLAQRNASRNRGPSRSTALRSSLRTSFNAAISSVQKDASASASVAEAALPRVPPPPLGEDSDDFVFEAEESEGAGGEGGAPESSSGGAGGAGGSRGLGASELDALQSVVAAGGSLLAGEVAREALAALYSAGLVRYSVPVDAADRIAVPPLQGFVMNRVGHDYLEKVRPRLGAHAQPSSVAAAQADP